MRKTLWKIKNKVSGLATRLTAAKGGSCGARNQKERENWLEEALSKIPAGQRILDAGAGELEYKRFCSHLNYVSQDFNGYDGLGDGLGLQAGSWNQSRLDILCDITSIPEPGGSFDAVLCVEVLEHLPEPVAALRELSRLLRPGGTLILTAPFCSLAHLSPHFYYTGYSRYFYEHWLDKLGFEIEEKDYNGNYFEYLAQEMRRLGSVGSEYSQETITFVEQNAINIVLGLLNRLSEKSNGAEQLLAFGLNIRARKQLNDKRPSK